MDSLATPAEFCFCPWLDFISGSDLQWPTGHHRGSSPDRALLDGCELERIPGTQKAKRKVWKIFKSNDNVAGYVWQVNNFCQVGNTW